MTSFRLKLIYLLTDGLTSYGVWLTFWFIRKNFYEVAPLNLQVDAEVLTIPALVSSLWLFIYWTQGLYRAPYTRSRVDELGRLLQASVIGVVIVSFVTFLDDPVEKPQIIRYMVLGYTALHFVLAGVTRFTLTTYVKRAVAKGRLGYRALIVGSGKRAQELWRDLKKNNSAIGYLIEGYVKLSDDDDDHLKGELEGRGALDNIRQIVKDRAVDDLIIALDTRDHARFQQILGSCDGVKAHLNVVPDMYDYLLGNVKIHGNTLDAPFVQIYPHILSPFEELAKRVIDVSFSIIALVLLAPFFAFLSLVIKLDSRGPIVYRQERVGKNGRTFYIFKFRSMNVDAEKDGPALSRDNDPRITRVGRILRKYRVDEFPQFLNVLMGDMSLVGPRPERRFYIEQIVKIAPEYRHLHKVKPGITSLGMVKYGYAENVEQMVQRMRYDVLYIENMSLALDFKILAYTVIIVLRREGK